MAYTDTELKSVPIKKTHLSELAAAVQVMAENKKLDVDFSGMSYEKINSVNVKLLQMAIHTLEGSFSGNCCQADCCQTCQGCESCEDCQTCQGCQSCQGSQTCQSCQKCQKTSQCKNCDCNCGDDS